MFAIFLNTHRHFTQTGLAGCPNAKTPPPLKTKSEQAAFPSVIGQSYELLRSERHVIRTGAISYEATSQVRLVSNTHSAVISFELIRD
jgi:hypothetical protein